jgi:hypothetical protein
VVAGISAITIPLRVSIADIGQPFSTNGRRPGSGKLSRPPEERRTRGTSGHAAHAAAYMLWSFGSAAISAEISTTGLSDVFFHQCDR